jgi:hypothetical protein
MRHRSAAMISRRFSFSRMKWNTERDRLGEIDE